MSNCPHPTTRASGICRQCSVERQFEHLKAQDDYRDCPECGQPTSYLEGACYRCRGAGQECERCGTKDADLTRRPVHELDEPMTMCPDCMRHLDRCGRLQVALTDGGVREHEAAAAREGRLAANQTWSEFQKVGDRLDELYRKHDNEDALEAFREVENLVMDLDDALFEAQEVFLDVIE